MPPATVQAKNAGSAWNLARLCGDTGDVELHRPVDKIRVEALSLEIVAPAGFREATWRAEQAKDCIGRRDRKLYFL
jgi:hypothetical protein